MSTSHKEKNNPRPSTFQTTDEKTPMNAVQIRPENWKKNTEWKMYTVHPFMTMCVVTKLRLSD